MANSRREKVEFMAKKMVTRPVRVEFYTKDGQRVSFKGHQEVMRPIKVDFYAKKEAKKK